MNSTAEFYIDYIKAKCALITHIRYNGTNVAYDASLSRKFDKLEDVFLSKWAPKRVPKDGGQNPANSL